jgi:hypothetical protein
MFVTDRRFGRFRDGRRSLRDVALVALAAAVSAAAPATAESVPHGVSTLPHSAGIGPRGGENLLAGSPRIGTVEALVPRRGRDAGRLIVWARVDHAPGTARALARERPETIHSGRVVARVGKRSRFATARLELDRSRVAHGYFMRFSKRATRALLAGRAGRRVPVSLRVAQTLDLDSDGDREDRALATTTRSVALARPATMIEPPDGAYVSDATNNSDSIQVSQGTITHYNFDPPCGMANTLDNPAPIDPSDGSFTFSDSQPDGMGLTKISLSGNFDRFESDWTANFLGNITVALPGDSCSKPVQGHLSHPRARQPSLPNSP